MRWSANMWDARQLDGCLHIMLAHGTVILSCFAPCVCWWSGMLCCNAVVWAQRRLVSLEHDGEACGLCSTISYISRPVHCHKWSWNSAVFCYTTDLPGTCHSAQCSVSASCGHQWPRPISRVFMHSPIVGIVFYHQTKFFATSEKLMMLKLYMNLQSIHTCGL